MRREYDYSLREWVGTLRAIGIVGIWFSAWPSGDGVLQVIENFNVCIVGRTIESQEFAQSVLVVILVGKLQDRLTYLLAEPNQSRAHQIQSMTRLILIGNTSREEMENSEQTKETLPPCSLTMGIATLLSAKAIYLTAWGEEKAEIMQKVVENSITDSLPASFLQTHPNANVVLDLSAASHLTRIEHPWLVTSCQWTDKLVRSALVWLCQKIGKPILKLTNKDYNENGLSELLARSIANEDKTGHRLNARTRLVGSDITRTADTDKSYVETSEGLDALLIKTAAILYCILSHETIKRENVLLLNVYVTKETLLQLIDGTERTLLLEWIILISIEYHNIAETQCLLLITADEFLIHSSE